MENKLKNAIRDATHKLHFFENTLQRMPIVAGAMHYAFHLGLGYVLTVNAANCATLFVNLLHQGGGGVDIFLKVMLQHHDDKLHRREIVVQHDDAPQRRWRIGQAFVFQQSCALNLILRWRWSGRFGFAGHAWVFELQVDCRNPAAESNLEASHNALN